MTHATDYAGLTDIVIGEDPKTSPRKTYERPKATIIESAVPLAPVSPNFSLLAEAFEGDKMIFSSGKLFNMAIERKKWSMEHFTRDDLEAEYELLGDIMQLASNRQSDLKRLLNEWEGE